MTTPATCESCGAAIVWVRSGTGRPMPLDPPVLSIVVGEGPITIVTDAGETVRGRKTEDVMQALVPGAYVMELGRVSHFATCPHAKSWRGRSRA